jgi:hypothetical protein
MLRRHFSRNSARGAICSIALAALLFVPSITSAQVTPEFSIGLLLGYPIGEFKNHVSSTGTGLNITGGIQLPRSPIFLGAELGFLVYGRDTRREQFGPSVPDVLVRVITSNNILQSNFFLRLQSPRGSLRPYLDGLVGFKYLFTETTVRDNGETIADYTNFDDWALAYGAGVGVAIALWGRESDTSARRQRSLTVLLDLGVRYLLGSEAEYLKEGSIQRVGGQVVFQTERSRTDLLYPHLWVRLSF